MATRTAKMAAGDVVIVVLVLLVVLTLVVAAAVRFRRRVSAKSATSDPGPSLRVVSTVTNPTYAKQQPGESSTDDVTFAYDTVVQSPGAVADEARMMTGT